MEISIQGVIHQKSWLLTCTQGQDVLSRAKDSGVRPLCTCNASQPPMYIAKRGELLYLARMPGTAKEHAEDCQSHIVPHEVYGGSDSPQELLVRLWDAAQPLLPEHCKWSHIKDALLEAANKIIIEGEPLSTRLLIPDTFDKQLAEQQVERYLDFYAKSDDDDGANRYFTVGIIKDIKPSKYSDLMAVKHMHGISFWVKKEASPALRAEGKNNILLALFVCRPVKTGVSVYDIATIEMDHQFVSFPRAEKQNAVISNLAPALSEKLLPQTKGQRRSDDDRMAQVALKMGLVPSTTRRELIDLLVDDYLRRSETK